jgi:hypothetical protein
MRFTEDHEWLQLDGDVATVGITAYAAEQLGDLVFIELPKLGAKVTKGAPAAVVESRPLPTSMRHCPVRSSRSTKPSPRTLRLSAPTR